MSSGVSMSASFFKRAKKERSGYLFILPHFIFFAVFFLIPVVWGIYYSFTYPFSPQKSKSNRV